MSKNTVGDVNDGIVFKGGLLPSNTLLNRFITEGYFD